MSRERAEPARRQVSVITRLWRGVARLLPVLVMTGIYALSSIPAEGLPEPPPLPIPHLDKWIHFVLYATLLLSFHPLPHRLLQPGEWLPGAMTAALLFGALDELHQASVPGRSSDWADLVADAAGIGVAALICRIWLAPRGATTTLP